MSRPNVSTTKKVAFAAAVVAALTGGAFAWQALRPTDDRSTVTAQRGDLPLTVEATGKLEAAVAYEIGPPSVPNMWNHNLQWMIPEGTRVKKGQVVARFDATEIDEQIRDFEAQLETVSQEREKEQRNLELKLEDLRLELVKAENELEKASLDLSIDEDLVAAIEFQQAKLRKELAERRLNYLREKIAFEQDLVASKLELLDVKKNYYAGKIEQLTTVRERFAVKAPIAGLVVYVPKRDGDRWEVGERVWMMAKILKVADLSTLRVESAVLEADASKVRPGQRAEISVDAVPGLQLESEVSEIGRIVRERSVQDRSKVFDVVLPLETVDSEVMRPGMSVSVTIETERLEDVVTLPLMAVRASDGGPFVLVRSGAGTDERVVELGPRNAESVVVTSGIEEGAEVVLGGEEATS